MAVSVGCDQLDSPLYPGSPPHGGASIFDQFAGRPCLVVGDQVFEHTQVDCRDLRDFLSGTSDRCLRGGFKPKQAFFPDRPRPIRLCTDEPALGLTDRSTVNFIVFGDAGRGQNSRVGYRQIDVAELAKRVCLRDGESRCDFAIYPGDIIYPHGVKDVWDARITQYFEDPYRTLGRLKFFLVLGNHDYAGNARAMIEYSHFSNRWNLPSESYAVPGLPAWLTMVGVDTQAWERDPRVRLNYDSQLNLLRKEICESASPWKLVFGHIPPLSHGDHGPSSEVYDALQTVYNECPFASYFAGHEHNQEHILHDYDIFIQGGGGAQLRPVRTVDDGSQQFAASKHGLAFVEASPQSLTVSFFSLEENDEARSAPSQPVPIYKCRRLIGDDHCAPM